MIKPKKLNRGDRVAIVSLSSGILGEDYCKHQLQLGIERIIDFGLVPVFMPNALKGNAFLTNHPEARADDLKSAYFDDSIKAIICAIGGDETYRILPFLMEDHLFLKKVKDSPKIFTGFSDTTNNHLFFFKLGVVSFYGPNFLSDLAELEGHMLTYTKEAFLSFFNQTDQRLIESSKVWYQERIDFSINALNTKRIAHQETKGYEVINGSGKVRGRLLGGCLESLYDGYTGDRFFEQKLVYDKYHLMPNITDWKDKILFFETSEEQPKPSLFRKYLDELANRGILDAVKAVLVGKPQNEVYYQAYKEILWEYAKIHHLPIMYNLNFGHAYPRNVIPYGILTEIDFDHLTVSLIENMLD